MANRSAAPLMVADVSERRTLPVPDGLEGERVDAALARMFGFSRSKAADMVAAGLVVLDGVIPAKSARVRAGMWLEIELPQVRPDPEVAQDLLVGLVVVYDDDDLLVVDKPAGIASHPSPGWNGPTVLGGLARAGYHVATSGAAERQGIVHRLDVGTSGLMVVARSERAYTHLKREFKNRTVDKTYSAVVQGHPDPSTGTVDAPIGRHPRHDWRWAVTSAGKESRTHYETIEAFPSASLLSIVLDTGRTHQIRVHMSAIRHPCVGDTTYGADPSLSAKLQLTRPWLHAKRLGFTHPDGRRRVLTSAYPPELVHALALLRGEADPE